MKSCVKWCVGSAMFIVLVLIGHHANASRGENPFPFGEHPFPIGEHPFPLVMSGYVQAVIDGDSVLVELLGSRNVYQVELAGVDAMERNYKGYHQGPGADYAQQALLRLLPRKAPVTIAFESKADRPQKNAERAPLVAHVFYWNEVKGKWNSVNEVILEQGWATVHLVFPHVLQADTYQKLTREAMLYRRGMFHPQIWNGEPYEFRVWVDRGYAPYWVGNTGSKRLYSPALFRHVPLWQRIYFENMQDALNEGYYLR